MLASPGFNAIRGLPVLRPERWPSAIRPLFRLLGWLVVFLAATRPCMAQEFRLTPLLELAIRQHPSVLQSRGLARSAYFELEGARWCRFPSLSTEVRSDSSYSQSVLRLEQPLWAGGRIAGRSDVSRTNWPAESAAVEVAQNHALPLGPTVGFPSARLFASYLCPSSNVHDVRRLLDPVTAVDSP